jgi:hypothetical protein
MLPLLNMLTGGLVPLEAQLRLAAGKSERASELVDSDIHKLPDEVFAEEPRVVVPDGDDGGSKEQCLMGVDHRIQQRVRRIQQMPP